MSSRQEKSDIFSTLKVCSIQVSRLRFQDLGGNVKNAKDMFESTSSFLWLSDMQPFQKEYPEIIQLIVASACNLRDTKLGPAASLK